MIVPRPGWAEHRAEEDWWGDFCALTREILEQSGVDPGAIACVATSAIGPCMLPVDAAGRPLMNGVLYGVDTRASAEVADLTRTLVGLVPAGRRLLFLEGGYDLQALAHSTGAMLSALVDDGAYRPEPATSGGPGAQVVADALNIRGALTDG